MNKEMLLNELMAQTIAEKGINNSMQNEIDAANEKIDEIKEKWIEFAKNNFPEEITTIMHRFDRNGKILTLPDRSNHTIHPFISVGDLHIAWYEKNLVFIKDSMTVGFYHYLRGTYEFEKKGNLGWDGYPVTFWENLPYNITLSTGKSGMESNRREIDKVYRFEQMYYEFEEALPKIYSEIARLNAEYVNAKRNTLSEKEQIVEEPSKKYRIVIDIEEV